MNQCNEMPFSFPRGAYRLELGQNVIPESKKRSKSYTYNFQHCFLVLMSSSYLTLLTLLNFTFILSNRLTSHVVIGNWCCVGQTVVKSSFYKIHYCVDGKEEGMLSLSCLE